MRASMQEQHSPITSAPERWRDALCQARTCARSAIVPSESGRPAEKRTMPSAAQSSVALWRFLLSPLQIPLSDIDSESWLAHFCSICRKSDAATREDHVFGRTDAASRSHRPVTSWFLTMPLHRADYSAASKPWPSLRYMAPGCVSGRSACPRPNSFSRNVPSA